MCVCGSQRQQSGDGQHQRGLKIKPLYWAESCPLLSDDLWHWPLTLSSASRQPECTIHPNWKFTSMLFYDNKNKAKMFKEVLNHWISPPNQQEYARPVLQKPISPSTDPSPSISSFAFPAFTHMSFTQLFSHFLLTVFYFLLHHFRLFLSLWPIWSCGSICMTALLLRFSLHAVVLH